MLFIDISIFENHYAKKHTLVTKHTLRVSHIHSNHKGVIIHIKCTKTFIIYSGNSSTLASKVRSQSKFKKLKKNILSITLCKIKSLKQTYIKEFKKLIMSITLY